MSNKIFVCILLLILINNNSFSQDAPVHLKTEAVFKEYSYLKLGSDYLSDNVYMGRKDADKQSFITTALGYYHKSGLYVNGNISYIPNAGFQRIDRNELSAGYSYNGDKFYGNANITKLFYNDSSNAINSSISAVSSLSCGYDFNYFSLQTALDVSFGAQTDMAINFNLSHPFYLADDKLSFSPTINLNAGSSNFYQEFYTPSKKGRVAAATRGRRKHKVIVGSVDTPNGVTTVLNADKFQLMDYELTAPIDYSINNFVLSFVPTYIIPVNPASITVNNINATETLNNAFVFQLGVSYKFH